MKVIAAVLFVALMGAGLARGDIVYGAQWYPGQMVGVAERRSPSQMAVPGFFSGRNYAPCPTYCWTFGAATEVIGYPGSGGFLIGFENGVGNMEPGNWSRKIANNAVFKCRPDVQVGPCSDPSNVDSIAYWVSAQPETGFVSAFKLDRYSIHDSPKGEHATVLDLGDLEQFRDFVFIKLPGGREVRFSEFLRALDR